MRCCWVFLFIVGLVLVNCSLDEPKAPSWNSTFNFPVTEKNFVMSELINENENLFDYEEGLLGLRVAGELDTTWVGDRFTIDDIEQSLDVGISNIVIPRLDFSEIIFAPPLFIADSDSRYNQSQAIPSAPFADVGGTAVNELGYASAAVASGTVRLLFENNLPVDLSISEIKLLDANTGITKIQNNESLLIKAKSSDSLDIDIGQVTISTLDQWVVSGTCIGSNGENVVLLPQDNLTVDVDLVDLSVQSLSTQGEDFYIEKNSAIVIGESVCIRQAKFSDGRLVFAIANNFGFDLNVKISSPQFVNAVTGQPLFVSIDIEKMSSADTSLHIQDYLIAFKGTLQTPQTVELLVQVNSAEPENQVTLNAGDALSFTFGMRDVVIKEFTGRLDQYDVAIEPIKKRVTLPDNIEDIAGFYLDEARLKIDFYNTIEMPMELHGTLAGYSADGKTASLAIDTDVCAGIREHEEHTQFSCESPDNKNVARLASLLPRLIEFSGSALVGDGQTEGSITSDSYFRTQYVLETPAHFAWNDTDFGSDTTYFQINPQNYEGGPQRPDAIELSADEIEKLEAFTLLAEMTNHLPVSGTIDFMIKEETPQGSETTELLLSPVRIASAKLDVFGRIEEEWAAKDTVRLGKADLAIFQNPGDTPKIVLLVTSMKMHGTHGKVKVYESDYLTINAVAQLAIGINKQ